MCSNRKSKWMIGSFCEIFINSTNKWHNGEVISIFKDKDGKWLKVKYFENNAPKICNIKHKSHQIKELYANTNTNQLLVICGYIRDLQNKSELFGLEVPTDLIILIDSFFGHVDSKILSENELFKLNLMISDHMNKPMGLQWKLLFRGSTDGYGLKNFSSKCIGIKDVIVIIETTKHNVFGGYTSIGFPDKPGSFRDEKAFIYSIRSGDDDKYPPKIFPIDPGFYNHALYRSGHWWERRLFVFGGIEPKSGICVRVDGNLPLNHNFAQGHRFGMKDGYLLGGKPGMSFQVQNIEAFRLYDPSL